MGGMSEEALVSVVIPTCNCGSFVREAVESVLRQTHVCVEVIVIDDGSSDDTRDLLEPYSDRIQVIHQENRGSAAARNVGLEASVGEFIAFLDADDRWHPRKLEWQLRCFREFPHVDMVFSDFSAIDSEGKVVAERYLTRAFGVFSEYRIEISDLLTASAMLPITDANAVRVRYGSIFPEICRGNVMLPSTTIFRRGAIVAEGLRFNESYRCAIDQDFHLRFSMKHDIAYLDATTADYRIGRAGQLSNARNIPWLILNTISTLKDVRMVEREADEPFSNLISEAIARRHAVLAYYYLSELETTEARRHAREALEYRTLSPRALGIFVLSLAPIRVIRWLGDLKRVSFHLTGLGS